MPDGLAVQIRFGQHVLDLGWVQDVLLDKNFGDLFVVHI